MNCTKCGAQAAETDAFCGSCGNPLAGSSGAPLDYSEPAAAPPPPPLDYGEPAAAPPPAPPASPYGAPAGPPPMAPPVTTYVVQRFVDPKTGVALAEWWQRAVAAILDGLIVGIPAWIIYFVLIATVGRTTSTQVIGGFTYQTTSTSAAVVILGLVIVYALWFGYYVYFNGGEKGQTVGKMVLGIATRDESGAGPIGYGRAAGRWAIVLVCSFVFWIPLILDYLSPLWDSRRQAWHDHVAKSVVVTLK